MRTKDLRPLLTAQQAGRMLNVPTRRIYKMTREGLLPHVKLGCRHLRYSEESLREWIAAGGTTGDRSQEVQ